MDPLNDGADRPVTKHGYGRLLGTAPATEKLREQIVKASAVTCPVLIVGETGTGKELVARAIHDHGARRDKPFVPVDCAALAPSLMESELFGHARGAFTGAQWATRGLLEVADGGTLFLDEIGELAPPYQAKLFRTLQEREIRPVGGTRFVKFEGRIVAATNRDLREEIRRGNFRKELYYRLSVLTIQVPALRQRRADIPLLVAYFLNEAAKDQPIRTFSDAAMSCLTAYDWPGNVRELENVVESGVALASGSVIGVADLAAEIIGSHEPLPAEETLRELRRALTLREWERQAIERAMEQAHGNKLQAAKILGMGKTTLYRKLKQLNVSS
jgi:two-component system response regulator HydG